jgi:uncharacterized membrane protein
MKDFQLFIGIGLLVVLIGCTNRNEDDLNPPPPVSNIIKYNDNVKPIIDQNCISCHGATPSFGATFSLISSAQVKNAILNRNLIARINDATNPMPSGGLMSPSLRAIVAKWQTDGFAE